MNKSLVPQEGDASEIRVIQRKEQAQCMIVTGGSRGIGGAIAISAGRAGYAVVVNYNRNAEAANRLVNQIETEGGRAIAIQCDVAESDQVRKLFEQVDDAFGAVDVLVNNAGILTNCRVDETEEALLSEVFRTNVFGTIYCSREAIRRMSTKHGGQGGVIINISSVAARLGGQRGGCHYAASKGAVDAFTNGLSKEVALEGIRVNAIRPGLIMTDIFDDREGREGAEARASTVPLQRVGLPQEIADVALWLASDAASYVHGAFIDVSGGR